MADHTFCRAYLREVMKDVRKVVPKEIIKEAWVMDVLDGYEFQIPSKDFYRYERAHCAWEMRANGWNDYMKVHHPDEYNELDTDDF